MDSISQQNTLNLKTELNKFENFVIPFNSKNEALRGQTLKEGEFYQGDKDDDDNDTYYSN